MGGFLGIGIDSEGHSDGSTPRRNGNVQAGTAYGANGRTNGVDLIPSPATGDQPPGAPDAGDVQIADIAKYVRKNIFGSAGIDSTFLSGPKGLDSPARGDSWLVEQIKRSQGGQGPGMASKVSPLNGSAATLKKLGGV